MNVEVKNKNTIEVKNIKSKSITSEKNSESVEKEESNISDEVDDEEQAKRAMLESDSETPTNEESLVEKFTKQSSTSDSFEEKDILQTYDAFSSTMQKSMNGYLTGFTEYFPCVRN